ncbi:hypothetical protein CEXT_117471 [Caerostris extrusa]|uniref:Uncharacterized protein n=1 Tax=Caerostris extrusa TaxID=172846 RepID=A0AAV4RYZ6_CAEEX|nr:hypothetical protein CEXT_117471 [Caerostris extrusa]
MIKQGDNRSPFTLSGYVCNISELIHHRQLETQSKRRYFLFTLIYLAQGQRNDGYYIISDDEIAVLSKCLPMAQDNAKSPD